MDRKAIARAGAALALVLVSVAAAAGGAPPVDGPTRSAGIDGGEGLARDPDGTNASRPGERLGGVVGVQGRSLTGAIDDGAFAAALADAEDDRGRAAVIDRRLAERADALDEVESRIADLERARDGGSAEDYRAHAATLARRLAATRWILDRAANATNRLPPALSREYDLEARVERLRERTDALRSEELAAAAAAVDGGDAAGETAPIALGDVVAAYRAGGGNAPGPWVTLFGTERIVVRVDRASGRTAVFGLVTEGGEVVAATRGPPDDPTLRVDTDYEVVERLGDAEDPWRVASRALAEDEITYRGLGAVNTVKYGLLAVMLFLFDGLRDLVLGGLDLLGGILDLVTPPF